MALSKLYLCMVTLALLYGNQQCIGETVRRLGKPSLQIMELNASPLVKEGDFTYSGVFMGPDDTEFEFKGNELDVTRGENNVFAAVLSNKDYNSNYKLTLKSKARRESLLMIFNPKYNLRPQTQFVENSCEVGIEKIAKGNSTEYIATVRNCTEQNIRKYFFIYILDKSENGGTVLSHNLDVPDDDHGFDYHKYVDTYYRESDKNIHYAVLNFPAMEADGITVKEFGFALSYSETFFFEEADVVAPRRLRRYEI